MVDMQALSVKRPLNPYLICVFMPAFLSIWFVVISILPVGSVSSLIECARSAGLEYVILLVPRNQNIYNFLQNTQNNLVWDRTSLYLISSLLLTVLGQVVALFKAQSFLRWFYLKSPRPIWLENLNRDGYFSTIVLMSFMAFLTSMFLNSFYSDTAYFDRASAAAIVGISPIRFSVMCCGLMFSIQALHFGAFRIYTSFFNHRKGV